MACNGIFTNLFRRKYASVHDLGAATPGVSPRVPPYPGWPLSPGPPHGPYLQVSHFKIGCAKLPWGAPTPPLNADYIDLVAHGNGVAYCPVDFDPYFPNQPETKIPPLDGPDFYFCKLMTAISSCSL